ncbi:MAG: hypothetical protein MUF74_05895 [Cypionkella sp.]|jgi:hypothetical protein|nr:hypothetical protein [Cypionkella sp.]
MAEVLFFILGSMFSLGLLAAVIILARSVPPQPVPVVGSIHPQHPMRPNPVGLKEHRAGTTLGLDGAARLAPPSRAERLAYATETRLDRAKRALTRIAALPEPAAARIAAQTLRRLADHDAPSADRLAFASARLELLALRPDPLAKRIAMDALTSFG